MAPNKPPSITETKTNFLQTQTRLLSQPLQPSPTWQHLPSTSTTDPDTDTNPLPAKTTTDLLTKLNAKLKSHSRLVFSPQSQRHVAEQIDTLYWNDLLSDPGNQHREDTVYIPTETDLTEISGIQGLPGTLPTLEPGYAELRARVEELAIQRDRAREKVRVYSMMRGLVGAFEGPETNVQGNLVGRGSEVEVELERLRVLVARVAGGLSYLDEEG